MTQPHHSWLTPWLELELTSTNIGIEYVINPTLYPALLDALGNMQPPIALYDFGSGTSSLAVDLLIRHPNNVPALRSFPLTDIQRAREKIAAYRGYEIESALVNHANARFTFYGVEQMRATQHNVAQRVQPIEHTKAMAVSRNMLMQLSRDDLRLHLQHTARLVGPNGYYIFSVLNPEYEQRKHPSLLSEEERYTFHHGKHGELGEFTQYFRSQDTLNARLNAFFHIENILPCRPLNDRFRKTHSRYYDPSVPMAFVYVTRAQKN